MKLVYLPRQLVYTNRNNLDDFLYSDDLNKELYKVYLRVKDRPYKFKFLANEAFNEAYYIATMAMNEPHPEDDVKEWRYIAQREIGWAYASNLVMSMVYAILNLQESKPDGVGYALSIMQKENYGEEHFPDFKEMVENSSAKYNSDFTVRPCPVKDLSKLEISWEDVTNNFDQQTIRELVSMFTSKDEQLEFISLIENSQNSMSNFELPF